MLNWYPSNSGSKRANRPAVHHAISFLLLAVTVQPTSAFFTLSSSLPFVSASKPASPILRRKDVPDIGFYDPHQKNDGHMLTEIPVTFPMGLGEPLNMVISAHSDPDVLEDREDQGGLRNYFLSMNFSGECLGQSLGTDQMANLGDGNGAKNETAVIRYNYGDPYVGSCRETIEGGNHFRYWVQNGRGANSGAIFMAASIELPIDLGHDIVRDGYNMGRDWVVSSATGTKIPAPNPHAIAPGPGPVVSSASVASVFSVASQSVVSRSSVLLTSTALSSQATSGTIAGTVSGAVSGTVSSSASPSSTTISLVMPTPPPSIALNKSRGTGNITAVPGAQYTGSTTFNGYWYQTTVTYYSGFMGNTSDGVNHAYTVEQDGRPAMDGLLAVFLVKIMDRPISDASLGSNLPAMLYVSIITATAIAFTIPTALFSFAL